MNTLEITFSCDSEHRLISESELSHFPVLQNMATLGIQRAQLNFPRCVFDDLLKCYQIAPANLQRGFTMQFLAYERAAGHFSDLYALHCYLGNTDDYVENHFCGLLQSSLADGVTKNQSWQLLGKN